MKPTTGRRVGTLTAFLCLSVIAVIVCAQEKKGRTSQIEVLEIERQVEAAVLKGDLEFFERILAEEFTHTTQSGVMRDRKQWLANHKAGQSPYDALNTQDLKALDYGDVVVVTGRIQPQGRTSTGQPIEGEYRFLRVWVKRDGQWKAVAFQSTRIASPKE
jgi:ketosteroid isomerase-like protein